MIPQNRKITAPSDVLSPVAKAAALACLDTLQHPDNADLVWTAARMEPQEIIAGLLRCAGKLAAGEASQEEIRGALLMATVWVSEAGNPAPRH